MEAARRRARVGGRPHCYSTSANFNNESRGICGVGLGFFRELDFFVQDIKGAGGERGIRTPDTLSGMPVFKSQECSDPFGKVSALFDFSTGYKANVLIRSDPKRSVLSMELLQFYYSAATEGRDEKKRLQNSHPARKRRFLARFCKGTARFSF